MKKAISILLVAALAVSFSVVAFASADENASSVPAAPQIEDLVERVDFDCPPENDNVTLIGDISAIRAFSGGEGELQATAAACGSTLCNDGNSWNANAVFARAMGTRQDPAETGV